MADKYGSHLTQLQETLALLSVEVVAERRYRSHLAEAARYLKNRDADDIFLGALALAFGVPLWSHDKDFDVLPVERFTTGRLLKLFGM